VFILLEFRSPSRRIFIGSHSLPPSLVRRIGPSDKKGVENVVADHLSRMNCGQDDKEPIEDKMRDDHLYRVLDKDTRMIDIIRAIWKMPLDHLDKNSKRRIISESQKYFWDAPYLFKLGNDGVTRRCVPREERLEILRKCHSAEYGGHYSHFWTPSKSVVQRILLAGDA
jgi:hypothetical protein